MGLEFLQPLFEMRAVSFASTSENVGAGFITT
jgi:hypothetical protein